MVVSGVCKRHSYSLNNGLHFINKIFSFVITVFKMPSKKKKYNSRFPPGRIKKIMQTDEEVGKVAQAVPVIISRALELFVESLLKKAVEITSARSAKTLTPSHMKHCILSESRFDFLKEFVKTVPDLVGDTDDSPGPSGAAFMGSSMDESNPCSNDLFIPLEHSNGVGHPVLPTEESSGVSGVQDTPLNLATGSTVPQFRYFAPDIFAKSETVVPPPSAPVTDLDED